MSKLAREVVARALAALQELAASLRAGGEHAHAGHVELSEHEHIVVLEVSREGGDWQRNLSAYFVGAGSGAWESDVTITDDEQNRVVVVGEAKVRSRDLEHVVLALMRAGTTWLLIELEKDEAGAQLNETGNGRRSSRSSDQSGEGQ